MKITSVEAVVVRVAQQDIRAMDDTHEAAIVLIGTDTGLVGVGEAGVAANVVKAFIDEGTSFPWSTSVKEILLGKDPRDPRTLWKELYEGTFWSARVGLGHIALAGVDMALWDLAGKAAGKPVWELLGEQRPDPVIPYLTLYFGPSQLKDTIRNTIKMLDAAREQGYRAAKIEALVDTTRDNDEIVELVKAVRRHAGPDYRLCADVGYRWKNAEEALDCLRRLEEFDLFFVETPFLPELIDDYRKVAVASRVTIAGAETLTAHAEYIPLLEAGVKIVQGGTCRVGITELDRLTRTAAESGGSMVPWGWLATSYSVAANLHVAVANANVPLVEHAPPELYPHFALRGTLAGPEPLVRNGEFVVPTAPGLGVELQPGALERFRTA